jgi:hypothetical protein
MKTKPPHGGQRKNAGRKKPPAPLDVVSVRLTQIQSDFAYLFGQGDRSAGIRRLIDAAIERGDLGR